MGGGGHDWQDREYQRSESRDSYEPKTLDGFSDRELQAELRKRKVHAKTEAERKAERAKHNAPLEKKIAELHREINGLKSKLK